MQVVALIFAALVAVAAGETCTGAQVDAVGFTSQDATIVTKIAYIADFTLSCSNGAKVSWVEDVATAVSGERPIKLYDDQGYAALRKAQRGNEDTSTVQPIAVINLYHPGAYRGPWIQSETMAILAAIFIYYYALTQKTRLMA
ncbi:Translocon-associated protein subunit delta [Portunus trituberculatus]|uniref:Translocon-associated protein subunit delta n=1 Tax=Portunus trituberculatus TaxID=210409 RepID=A0A5B7DNI6_PORTR|nr:Translocon-associated protein subunit delta [Portunus trituberculatus]